MKTQLKFGSAIVVALGIYSAAFAAPTAQIKADASSVNSACAQEAQTAGCTGEVVGKGLMKCLATYKKANKSFEYSPACKDSLKTLRGDRKAAK